MVLYADNHRGICLVFDGTHAFFKNAQPVLYTHSPVDVQHIAASGSLADELAFCKSLGWQFQKEWRIVFPEDEPRSVAFPKESLVAVILGYRFMEFHFEELKNTLLKGGYSVEVHRVKRVPDSYDFMLVPMGRIGSQDNR